ncbi:hypothetical protein [Gaoshiqia sp. Z1-71]|uniref:hypothetical protein n=1 Tax=Gaoshiqia hydrogeniformans TaxID=3290090 RepID=UPI003BF89359
MRKLSFIILLTAGSVAASFAQSRHGDNFKMDCAACHSPESWELLQKEMTFDHTQTRFELTGQHKTVDCKSCHASLMFSEARNECISCHTDMHNNTVGTDCDRCHNPQSWIVVKVSEMHRQSRFPLLGSHATADCFQCHVSASNLQFEPLGIACVDCHRSDYLATTQPNHQGSGYSTECTDCHSAKAISWTAANFEHNFFPLAGGHTISCMECHVSGVFEKIPNECVSCHQADYNATTNPAHLLSGFSTNCAECHTLNRGWQPAKFTQHDAGFFPIFSGKHKGKWDSCTDCHANPSSYAEFSCLNCHEHSQARMDDKHEGRNGYTYESNACYSCHPTGSE